GTPIVRKGRLTSLDFIAFSADEEKALHNAYELIKTGRSDHGITIEWDPRKRSLCVFSMDPACDHGKLRVVADRIKEFTGIDPIYAVFNEDNTSIYLYTLKPDEEREIRSYGFDRLRAKEWAIEAIPDHANEEILYAIDTDDIVYEPWNAIRDRFANVPQDFALDLVGPTFSDTSFWEEAFPSILSVDSEDASSVSVSGGKGSNTHTLRKLMSEGKITGLQVPDTSVITTYAYQNIVLGNSSILEDIKLLDIASGKDEARRISERIRNKILALDLPEPFKNSIEREFYNLGGNIAVRSSATAEDLKEFAAAGLAQSYLPVTSAEEAQECVKKVWASLFDEGFVNARVKNHLSHSDAFMAVMLQKVVEPRSAGVVFTINSDERPVFVIQAKPGYGEGVVQGEGKSDRWLAGFMGDTILEKRIVDTANPSMTDKEVLELSRLVKLIQRQYKAMGCADNIDVEFVVDKDGGISIVQVRAKQSFAAEKDGEATFLISVVDEAGVPAGTKTTDLDPKAVVATYGAVTAKIQVLRSNSDILTEEDVKHLAARAKPGVILVTHHTNNEFNGVFSKLAGVITTDGNMTSHAAQNSAPLKIPCLVGASDAFEKLAQYDGQMVTFDADKRRIYLGVMPIIEEERKLSIWEKNDGESEAPEVKAVESREPHEIFQRWAKTQAARPEVFNDYPEDGHLRLRSNAYRKFELDYYYRAWDRLTIFLTRFFSNRVPWPLQTQDRVFKPVEPEWTHIDDDPFLGVVRNKLCHRITQNDPRSIFYYIRDAKDLSEEDMQALFDARWRGFQRFSRFMNSIEAINAANVEQAVDEMIEAFVWMHFGFWLDVTVTHLFAHDQLRYVNSQYHQILQNEAVRDLPQEETVDGNRPDVPHGKILKLSRIKDKEIGALVERIWNDPRLLAIIELRDTQDIISKLRADYPSVLELIDGWSHRFKETSEHLDELSDTTDYIEDIRGRVMAGNTVRSEFIASLCLAHMERYGHSSLDMSHVKATDENLFLLIHGYARVNAAMAKTSDWKDAGVDERIAVLKSVSLEELNAELESLVKHLTKLITVEQGKRDTARKVLSNPDYSRLKKIAALSHQEFLLREDGHHLIVPHQRKMARMMLVLGERYKETLGDPRKIFDISTDELIALVREPDPRFVALSFERERKLQAADNLIYEEWQMDPKSAVEHFSKTADELLSILDCQITAATIPRVKRSYQEEAEYIRGRVKWFRGALPMITLKELLNVRDVSREKLNADVLLICGNDMLDGFAEAVDLYASGKVKKILVSGGLGKGTLALLRSALLERIPIKISDNEVISHENHMRYLEDLEKAGKLRTVLKVSEADVICQILAHMAKKRMGRDGNPAPVEIKEEDIIREEKTTNILEYFTNCRPILYRLRHELKLSDRNPLTVAYIHDPAIQFRTKSLFDSIFQADIASGALRGLSYTVEYDIYGLRREAVQETILREMFAIMIYTKAGHMAPLYNGKLGINKIPAKYWKAAAVILDDYPDKERLRNLFRKMISGLISKEQWFPSDIREIVNFLPESAAPFKASILRLFELSSVPESEDTAPALCLETISNDEGLMAKALDPSRGVTVSDMVSKRTGSSRIYVEREFALLGMMGIIKEAETYDPRYNPAYCFSAMMLSPSAETRAG
ncbi:MAG: hypothetical protein KBB52_07955, partial [Candidatus Omnitrophica bacterium]|nr:hypothetical protein [Candidatus Omnitrophota bacterium]